LVSEKASERHLTDQQQSGKNEQRILEVLAKGLSTEFPNPKRVGCPGSATLEGMASHRMPLSEADKWLEHLGSCSPCFQEFTAIRNKLRARRRFKWGGSLAILLAVLALWLSLRPHRAPNETAVLDLRGHSVSRGEQSTSGQTSLQLGRGTQHLVVDLPVGSKEGSYDLALFNDTDRELLYTSGLAELENHVVVLRVEVNVAGVPPGSYFLALRRPGLEWTRFSVRVF
jgi:hypothetical protein